VVNVSAVPPEPCFGEATPPSRMASNGLELLVWD